MSTHLPLEVHPDPNALKKYKRKTLMEHLVGPTGSVIFHVLIVFAAIRLMVFTQEDKPLDIEVMLTTPETVELEDFNKELEKLDDLQDMSDVITPPDVDMAMEAPSEVENVNPNPAPDTSTDLSALNVMNDVQSPLVMKGLYAGRSAGGRASALGQYGGRWGEYTERAVIKALEWLKNHQLPDGSWEPKSDAPAMTGLALLAFLAHGETTSSEKYGPTVEKAIRFLVSKQQENGAFTTINQHGVYEHAIATYAICEAYGLTRIPSLKPVMEKAVDVMIKGQQPGGSWDYFYKKEARKDLSVAGWHIQALKAAYIAGAENPELKAAIDKGIASVKTFQNPQHGLFGYTGNDISANFRPSLTGVAVLCMQLCGHHDDKEAKLGIQALKSADCDWAKPTTWPMYAWYYITQAKFHEGGNDWTSWNNQFAREFTKNQNEDGSWFTPSQNEERGAGPVYATALAALTLQVYYRFLPTYKPIKTEQKEEKSADEVSVEII